MRKIPWQSRKELHLQLAVSCGVNHGFNALQINSYVFRKECKWKKICSVDERWHLRSANSASITSPSHWPSSGDVWVRACNVWLPQGPSYSMNVVVRIGKQRLYKFKPRDCHQILTSARTVRLRQNDNLRFCQPCEKCEWWGRRERAPINFLKESFADEETCRDRYHIDHAGRWLDQRVAILADQPLCSDELDDISFQVFFAGWSASSCFSRSLHATAHWDRARAGSARCSARDDQRARYPRARPSCCGFWNLVIAHAWKFPQA